jgi:hypothetical protein
VDLRRLRAGEWIAGLSGAALVVDLFLPWYGAEGTSATATAWEAFAVNDAILLLVALFAVGLWTAAATQRTSAVPVGTAALTVLLALVGTILVVIRLVFEPSVESVASHATAVGVAFYGPGLSNSATIEYGAWIGLVAVLGIVFGGYRSMADERTPRSVAPSIDVTPLPPPRPEGDRTG